MLKATYLKSASVLFKKLYKTCSPFFIATTLPSLCLDEFACLWNGCEFLSMGSLAELEVHAYFHNYHGKLKFIGSQLLKSRPDLPSCNQGVHSNNLVPEGSDGYVCQWEHCDVGIFSSVIGHQMSYCSIFVKLIFISLFTEYIQQSWVVLPTCWQSCWKCWATVSPTTTAGSLLPLDRYDWAKTSLKMFFVIVLSIFHVSVTGCDAFFKIRYRLREHMRSHTQERLVACPTCGSMFSSNTKLFDHLHRQAEPVGETNSSVCIISVLKVYRKYWPCYIHVSFEQSRWFVNTVAKLFPARDFWGITFVSTVIDFRLMIKLFPIILM